MSGPLDHIGSVGDAAMDGPNTHRMDAPSDVTSWTVIPTTRNVPTDDGRGMTLRDEWWHVPTFVVEEIERTGTVAPVEQDIPLETYWTDRTAALAEALHASACRNWNLEHAEGGDEQDAKDALLYLREHGWTLEREER